MSQATTPGLDPRNSFARRVLQDTFAQLGAKLGFLWIGLVAFMAVFAPFIASSHPYAMRTAEGWSSPMLAHLSWVDVTMVVTAIACVVAWRWRDKFAVGRLLLAVIGVAIVVGTISSVTIEPPRAVVFDQYRVGLAQGTIEQAYFAPIPFSPTDRARDNPKPLQSPDTEHWFGVISNWRILPRFRFLPPIVLEIT